MVTLGFYPQTEKLKPDVNQVQQNKQYHMTVLLSSFHSNGYTPGFHPQT